MKTLKAKLSLITLLAIGFGSVYAQEYDDMYFSANDRKQVKYVSDEKSVSQDLNEVQQITQDPAQNYSARTVNPEYIAKYQASSEERASAEFADDEYFVEDYNDNGNLNNVSSNFQNTNGIAVRDRFGNMSYFNSYSDVYWSDPFLYQGTIFDPLYRPYYRGYGYGYRPFRSGWSMSFGFGSGWYSGYSWNAGWGYGGGFGYGYDPFYCPPYYNSFGYGGYYGYGYPYRTVIINNYENRNDRTYRRGPGPSRSGINSNDGRRSSRVASNGRSSNDGRVSTNGRTAISNSSRARYISDNSDRRDYDNAQSRYYRRSRSAVNDNDASNSGRTYESRSRSSSSYTPDTRSYSSSNRSSVERRSSSSSNSRSTYNNRSYNSRSNNSSYSRPSNSRSNSYSPSRSSSPSRSNSSVGSSSRSRSSSGVSRSSSSSRSSGSRSSSGSSRRRGGN